MYDPRDLKIYVDGSSLKNPGGPGGIGGIIEYPDGSEIISKPLFFEGYKNTTNQRMELRACIKGLEYMRAESKNFHECMKILSTDSIYVYENYSRAIHWKKNEWMNSHGRPMENPDLWNEFLSKWQKTKAEIRWKKGKSDEMTIAVDKLAKKGAKNPIKVDFGYIQGRVTPKKGTEKTAKLFSAQNQTLFIRIYRHAYKKAGNLQKVYFNLYSELENNYYGNYFSYISYEEKMHSWKCYEAFFNDNSNFPMIEKYNLKDCPCV